ncbi:MAG: hypothetical protein H7Z42_07325 [Roseiflexaceae bacterium]|nr:hypothetical protein [Roseiflexaceae bacterium]
MALTQLAASDCGSMEHPSFLSRCLVQPTKQRNNDEVFPCPPLANERYIFFVSVFGALRQKPKQLLVISMPTAGEMKALGQLRNS